MDILQDIKNAQEYIASCQETLERLKSKYKMTEFDYKQFLEYAESLSFWTKDLEFWQGELAKEQARKAGQGAEDA